MSETDRSDAAEALAGYLADLKQGASTMLGASLVVLGPERAQLFRTCAIPHHVSADIVRVLAPEVRADSVDEILEAFAQLSFVRRAGDDLLLHEDARRELFEEWFNEERREAFANLSSRLAEFFAQRAASDASSTEGLNYSWQAMFHLIGAEPDAGIARFLELFADERRNGAFGHCAQLLALVFEYRDFLSFDNWNLARYCDGLSLMDRHEWAAAGEIFDSLEASSAGDLELRAKVRLQKAQIALLDGDRTGAHRLFREALSDAELAQASHELCATIRLYMARAHAADGELAEAERHLRWGLDTAKYIGHAELTALGLETLGALLRKRNEPGKAIEIYRNAIACITALGDRPRLARALTGLGLAHLELNEFEEARAVFEERLQILSEIGDRHGEAITLNNLIRIYVWQGQRDEAINSAERAAGLFLSTRDFLNCAISRSNLAKLYRRAMDLESAARNFQEAIEMFRRTGNIDRAAELERELAALGG